jgi:hypothetical protein
MIQILVPSTKSKPKRRFFIEFEVGIEAIKAWKNLGESDEDFIKRLVLSGLSQQAEKMEG